MRTTFAILLIVHFIADFLLQTDWMAVNKSKNWLAMGIHIAIYTTCLMPFGFFFALINGGLHLATDTVTSRATSRLYKAGKRHWFFVVIGADQLVHALCLLFTI